MKIGAYVADGDVAAATVNRVSATLLATGDIKPPAKPANAFYDDRYVRAVAN